ncbi:DUF87 domain-containing protein [Candidatus Woesearchaeota archaeon]|nr:DUF87 domain-containing protein [Candidatus Woesearchaeota archaeon]
MTKGIVISGEFGKILVRQKSDKRIEIGELLLADTAGGRILLQVYDLLYGSQISQQNLELISGMHLEEDTHVEFMDPELRNYNLALLKTIISIEDKDARICKSLPDFFSKVRDVDKKDLGFLTKPSHPLFVGMLRSGSRTLDLGIFLHGSKVFAHHILIPATTGRGKSNLTSCMLWDTLDKDYCGILVLDPHDEYYGRNKFGLKDHPSKEKLVYYTPNDPPAGARTLKINLRNIRPHHLNGVIDWSSAQKDALTAFYRNYGSTWIESIVLDKPVENIQEGTLAVVKRKILNLLSLSFDGSQLFCRGVFDIQAGQSTVPDICSELEHGNTVIVDTSSFSGAVEILVGSLIASEILKKYKHYKTKGTLRDRPVISVVLEEAPRVLGKDVLEKGQNIFSTIAREGRKFKVGLTAITQLPSLIPRQILANMNTKIILGIEMAPERAAIIESASQDLSQDSRNIASLDIGEAIITSNFARFATPVKIPRFESFAKSRSREEPKRSFAGIDTG